MNIEKIVIVGGGSAGWMTAAMLVKSFPNKDISVIESPKIRTVGVGESTYDGINYYFEFLGIDKDSFFKETDASIKLGLEFVDFEQIGNNFYYPFGVPSIEGCRWGMQDWMIRKYKNPDIESMDFSMSYFPVAHCIKYNTFYNNRGGEFPNFDPRIHTALHFDASKFANWLMNNYCLPRGVKRIEDEIVSIDTNNEHIKFLITETGKKIEADLFIDCTGFKSLLLGQALEEPFNSYSDKLPNNRAWATQVPYIDKRVELESTTRCTALGNGWVWNIPLWSRLGSGYVYSDKYISKEDALKEFKLHLKNSLKINRKDEDIDSLEFKDISMRVGIHERTWVGNCVAIGLSAAFIEPLESNGLFSIHEFLFQLVRALSRSSVSSWDIAVYNEAVRSKFNIFAEFIRIHYALSLRDDTEYWSDNKRRHYDFNFDLIDQGNALTFGLQHIKTTTNETFHNGGFMTGLMCIATGMNYPVLDSVSARLGEIEYNVDYSTFMEENFKIIDSNKTRWSLIAKQSPTLVDYIQEKYHDK